MAGSGRFLCRVDDLPINGAKGFAPVGGAAIFLVRRGDQLTAYHDLCPHYGQTRLAWKLDQYLSADREHIMCSAHGALFRIDDGYCVQGPCLGQSLTVVPIILSDGNVWLLPESGEIPVP